MSLDLAPAFLDFVTQVDALETTLNAASDDGGLRRFVHSSRGMETAAFLVTTALRTRPARFCLYYRCHAWLLALGAHPRTIAEAVIASAPLSPMQPRLPDLPIDFISVTVGAQLPVALGMALAGIPTVAVMGDGAMSTGVVFETLNTASIHRPDILFVLDDNNRAVSSPGASVNGADTPELCRSLRLDYHHVGSRDTDAFYEAVDWLSDAGRRPRLLHVTSKPTDQHSLAASPTGVTT